MCMLLQLLLRCKVLSFLRSSQQSCFIDKFSVVAHKTVAVEGKASIVCPLLFASFLSLGFSFGLLKGFPSILDRKVDWMREGG